MSPRVEPDTFESGAVILTGLTYHIPEIQGTRHNFSTAYGRRVYRGFLLWRAIEPTVGSSSRAALKGAASRSTPWGISSEFPIFFFFSIGHSFLCFANFWGVGNGSWEWTHGKKVRSAKFQL